MSLFSYNSPLVKLYSAILTPIGKIDWGWIKEKFFGRRYYNLTDKDLNDIRELLSTGYYIIETRRNCVMSTYLICLANFVKTGKFGHYDHVLLNVEDDNPEDDIHFQLYQATASGSSISTFMEVFDCDSVVLMRPKNITVEEWHIVVEHAKKQIGKPYDDLFDLNDDTHLSCVELVRNSLRGIPGYDEKFPNLEASIKKVGNLTPQMYYDCPDFEVVYEIRR